MVYLVLRVPIPLPIALPLGSGLLLTQLGVGRSSVPLVVTLLFTQLGVVRSLVPPVVPVLVALSLTQIRGFSDKPHPLEIRHPPIRICTRPPDAHWDLLSIAIEVP